MQTWIDFVGSTYYSKQGFIDEAKQYGVTRRVSVKQLASMQFGDRVLTAIHDGKTPVLFGYFLIERLSGLSADAVKALTKGFTTKLVSQGGRVVHRGCGSYIEGATLVIDATIEEIVEVLKKVSDPGKLMVGGAFEDHEETRFKSMTGRMPRGFRLFDYEAFLVAAHEARQTWDGRGYPVVTGHFYAKAGEGDEGFVGPLAEIEAEVQEILDYERVDDKDEERQKTNVKVGRPKGMKKRIAKPIYEQVDIEDLIEKEEEEKEEAAG